MARQPQPVEHWPRWLHFGCVGCSVLVAAALIGAAASVAVIVHRHIQRERQPAALSGGKPLEAFESGCLGVVRAAGYEAWQVVVLPDGRALALGSWVPTLPSVFAQVLGSPGNPDEAAAGVLRRFSPHLLILAAGQSAREVAVPESDGKIGMVEQFCLDGGGQRVAARLVFTSPGEVPEQGPAAAADEIWSLDLPGEQWRHVLSLSADRQVSLLGWLASGRSIAALIWEQGKEEAQLCLIGLDGTLRRVATLPRVVRYWRPVAGGRVIELAYVADLDEHDVAGHIYSVNLATGRLVQRPIGAIPAVQPGPLAGDEELFFRQGRLGALSWAAARVRWITWSLGATFTAVAQPDGRWALVGVGPTYAIGRPDRLVAVNLSDGQARLVAKGEFTVLAAAPGGRSFWVSASSKVPSALSERNAQILQVYMDWDALSRASWTGDSPQTTSAQSASGKGRAE